MTVNDIGDADYQAATTREGVVVVDLWAEWCGPCHSFAPVFEAASGRWPNAHFLKVNVDLRGDIAAGLQVRSIPTLLIYRDGKLYHRSSGTMPGEKLDELLSGASREAGETEA